MQNKLKSVKDGKLCRREGSRTLVVATPPRTPKKPKSKTEKAKPRPQITDVISFGHPDFEYRRLRYNADGTDDNAWHVSTGRLNRVKRAYKDAWEWAIVGGPA